VLARDCVASIRRWSKRDPYGGSLTAATDELTATDDRTLVFRLKRPFPLLPAALGKVPTVMPAMMPERLAQTDAATQPKEVVGSGPFRFKADERVAGHRTVYERFEAYQPRETGNPDWTAGPKRAHFDRVVWTVMPDASTAGAALEKGEHDWWEYVPADLLPPLRRKRGITTSVLDPTGFYLILRLNHLHPPFDNPAIRRALLGAVNQQDFVDVVAGPDPSMGRTGVGLFCPSSPMASGAGMEALTGARDLERARRAIVEAGYDGTPIVALAGAAGGGNSRMMAVAVDVMRKIGLVVDLQTSDWGTMTQWLFKQEPISQGGWNCLSYDVAGVDVWDPAVNNYLRSIGRGARPGWPSSPALEALRDRWLETADAATRKEIAAKLQLQAFEDVPYIPLGVDYLSTAYRSDLSGVLNGFAVFWNVSRQG
jgi:peptide/nickel transport system substrate-binding protein